MKHFLVSPLYFVLVLGTTPFRAQESKLAVPAFNSEYAMTVLDKSKGRLHLTGGDTTKPKSAYVIEATSPAGVKKKVRRNLDEATFEGGGGITLFTGGDKKPFAGGPGAYFGAVIPYPKNHVAIEYLLNLDYCMGPSKSWYARSVGSSSANIISLSGGCNMDVGMVVSAILINKHTFSVIVGPELMFESIYLSTLKLKTGDIGMRDQILTSFATGIKASAYIGERLIVNLEYSDCLKSNVSYEAISVNSPTISTPINLNLLRVGVGCRF